METDTVLRVLDECTAAGCLSMLLTGGEPLLRRDFAQIYRHAKMNGLLVSLFTNGTLVDEEIVSLFADLPPHGVEISLYGSTEGTYEKITGVPGSYRKCIDGIERLLAGGINVKLKTMLMTWNQHEFFEIEKMAEKYGVKFRFDPCIFPRLDGNKSPLFCRVSAREAVEAEFANAERARSWKELFERMAGTGDSNRLFYCGAGVTGFHVDATGALQPCLMVRGMKYDLAGSFSEGWEEIGTFIDEAIAGRDFSCKRCTKKILCGYCPASFELENGKADEPSAFFCEIGQKRWEMITGNIPETDKHDLRQYAETAQT